MSATLSLEGGQRRSSGWQWRMRLKWQASARAGAASKLRTDRVLRRFRDLPAVSASGMGVTARGAGELSQAEVGVCGQSVKRPPAQIQ